MNADSVSIRRYVPDMHPIKAIQRITPVVNPPSYSHLTKWQKLSLIAGVTLTPFGLAGTIDAIFSSPHFNWFSNTISSLLNGAQGALLSAVFVTSGALAAMFGYGFRESLPKSKVYDAEVWTLVGSSAMLSVAGVVHPPSALHPYFAGGYFIGDSLTIGAMGVTMAKQGAKISGGLTIASGTTALTAIGIGYGLDHQITALYEFIASSAIGTWIFSSSLYALAKNRIMDVVRPMIDRKDKQNSAEE